MKVNADITSGFAVLVFVHGESWAWGSSHLYDARILATLGRIIVVTFNYRLGVFGRNREMQQNPPKNAKYLLQTPPVLRFPQYKSLPDDEGERRQLRPGWPDGGPAVGGGEHQAIRGGQLQDNSDGTGGSVGGLMAANFLFWANWTLDLHLF